MLTPFLAGQDTTAALLTTAFDNTRNTKMLLADVSSTVTTFTDCPDLTFALSANAGYIFDSQIIYDAPSAGDVVIRFTAPAGTTIRAAPWGIASGTSTTSGAIVQSVTDQVATATMSFGGVATGTMMMARIAGFISVITASGNIVLGFAQLAASGTTTLKIGTSMALARVV